MTRPRGRQGPRPWELRMVDSTLQILSEDRAFGRKEGEVFRTPSGKGVRHSWGGGGLAG